MELIIAMLFLPIPLIIGVITYKYTKFRKKYYKYIPALIMFIINGLCWIKLASEPTNDNGIAYILPATLSNLLGVVFYLIALRSDYKKSKKDFSVTIVTALSWGEPKDLKSLSF